MEKASELASRLAEHVEAVCRHYLCNGHRIGHYWVVGDARNHRGRSMYVRLKEKGGGKGAAGKWTDAATNDHGDLLDIIRYSLGLNRFTDVVTEARRFLSLPLRESETADKPQRISAPTGSPESARRLFSMSRPIKGTLAETYLGHRAIPSFRDTAALRFHPRCYYSPDRWSPTETRPAMIAAVTDLDGTITGAHRTWLDPSGKDKAPINTPRRAMGRLLGNAVRFGIAGDVMAAGEGIETVLSIKYAMTAMPMMAALSAAHLAAIRFPPTLRRLYIARDKDPAGEAATAALLSRAQQAGIEAVALSPQLGDFNEDLSLLGIDGLRMAVRTQILPQDVARFMIVIPESREEKLRF